jgi:predicted ATP-grasp superfamily ATP-dependent carboligase
MRISTKPSSELQQDMINSVLVLDARIGACLSIVRSLAKKEVNVYCGTDKRAMEGYYDSNSLNAISSYSRYVRRVFYYPDPIRQTAFEKSVRNISKKFGIEVIIPVAQRTTVALSRAKERLKHIIIPVSDFESLSIGASKRKTIQLAKKLNIPYPNTMTIDTISDLQYVGLEFPLVVKGVYGGGTVTYVQDLKSLKKKVNMLYQQQGEYPLIQEYIKGQGYGFFALFNDGDPRAIFMHKRIREYPATGGMSTCAESVYEPKLLEYGLRMLKALHWHGVAMVEFKRQSSDNQFKLMEINPRFWGSLDLPIASGVNFPYLLYKMAVEGDIESTFGYRTGTRFVWTFPMDLVRTFKDKAIHSRIKPFLLDLIDPRIHRNIYRNDLNPSIMQFAVAINHFYNMAYGILIP